MRWIPHMNGVSFLDEGTWKVFLIINIVSFINISLIQLLFIYWAVTVYQELFPALGVWLWTEQVWSFSHSTGKTDVKHVSTCSHVRILKRDDRVMAGRAIFNKVMKESPHGRNTEIKNQKKVKRESLQIPKEKHRCGKKSRYKCTGAGYNKAKKDVCKSQCWSFPIWTKYLVNQMACLISC